MTKLEKATFEQWAGERGHDIRRRGRYWYQCIDTTELAKTWHEAWTEGRRIEQGRCQLIAQNNAGSDVTKTAEGRRVAAHIVFEIRTKAR